MASLTRIQQLSTRIAQNTETVQHYLQSNKIPTPSLDADALWQLPIPDSAPEVSAARRATIEDCQELSALMTGAKELVHYPVHHPIYTNLHKTYVAMLRQILVHLLRQR